MSRLRKVLMALAILLVLMQFVPAELSNPPVTGDIGDSAVSAALTDNGAPPEVQAILRRACYDCHSHETSWPWYAHIAPVKFLLAHDVEEGRAALNFSTWSSYSAKQAAHKREEVWEKVEEGEMPLWFYLPLHPSAKLDDDDRAVLRAWSESPESE